MEKLFIDIQSQKLRTLRNTTKFLYGQVIQPDGRVTTALHPIFKERESVNFDLAVEPETEKRRKELTAYSTTDMATKNSGYFQLEVNAQVASVSAMLGTHKELQKQTEACYQLIQYQVPKETARLFQLREPCEDFLQFFELHGGVNEESVVLFFKNYGILVPEKVVLGGVQCTYSEILRGSTSSISGVEAKGSISAGFGASPFSGKASGEYNRESISKKSIDSSNWSKVVIGGDVKMDDLEDEWVASLEKTELRVIIEVQDYKLPHEFLSFTIQKQINAILKEIGHKVEQPPVFELKDLSYVEEGKKMLTYFKQIRDNEQWKPFHKKTKDDGEITMEVQMVGPVRACKIQGVVNHSINEVYKVVANVTERSYDPFFMKGTLIRKVGPTTHLLHIVYGQKNNFGVKPRDLFLVLYIERENQEYYVITSSVKQNEDQYCPENSKYVRGELKIGAWQLTQLGNDQTQVTYIKEFKWKGNVPYWVQQKGGENQTFQITGLEEAVKRNIESTKGIATQF